MLKMWKNKQGERYEKSTVFDDDVFLAHSLGRR